jgi:hypothetical protein
LESAATAGGAPELFFDREQANAVGPFKLRDHGGQRLGDDPSM